MAAGPGSGVLGPLGESNLCRRPRILAKAEVRVFYQLYVNPSHLLLRRALPTMDQIECSDYEGRGNEGKVKLDAEDIEVQSFMGREKKEDNY